MGTSDGESYEYDSGLPRHRVAITKPFLIGQTQVTQELWEVIMGRHQHHLTGENLPVDHVSWFDCIRFCNALSEAEGLETVYRIGSGDEPIISLDVDRTGYRLPTEAEWEYMAKAGTDFTYAGSDTIDEVAWCGVEGKRPVGQKNPNNWAIYDCSGNVDEWCNDMWDVTAYDARTGTAYDPHEWSDLVAPRVYRGGITSNISFNCCVAFRNRGDADYRGKYLGFRLLRGV